MLEFSGLRDIELLTRDHDRKSFTSGVNNLDNYLRDRRAIGDMENNLSRVFVLTLIDEPKTIVGYYSLSSHLVPTDGLPESIAKRFKYKFVGTTLLGKLAVGEDWQRGKCDLRLGEHLLVHAMFSAWTASTKVASFALVVDVLSGEKGDPKLFYTKKGFIAFQDKDTRLFLPMETIESALRSSGIIK